MANNKYTRLQKYISIDGGQTFNPVTPAEYIPGELIEADSVDCGAQVITWVDVEGEYVCELPDFCEKFNDTKDYYYNYPDGTYHRQTYTTVQTGYEHLGDEYFVYEPYIDVSHNTQYTKAFIEKTTGKTYFASERSGIISPANTYIVPDGVNLFNPYVGNGIFIYNMDLYHFDSSHSTYDKIYTGDKTADNGRYRHHYFLYDGLMDFCVENDTLTITNYPITVSGGIPTVNNAVSPPIVIDDCTEYEAIIGHEDNQHYLYIAVMKNIGYRTINIQYQTYNYTSASPSSNGWKLSGSCIKDGFDYLSISSRDIVSYIIPNGQGRNMGFFIKNKDSSFGNLSNNLYMDRIRDSFYRYEFIGTDRYNVYSNYLSSE